MWTKWDREIHCCFFIHSATAMLKELDKQDNAAILCRIIELPASVAIGKVSYKYILLVYFLLTFLLKQYCHSHQHPG